jgi:NitT/TauT family transport system substrate-binding protein
MVLFIAGGTLPAAASGDSPVKLRVTALPYFAFAPLYIADAEGYFAEEGLDVEFVRFQRNADSLPALLRGDIDVDTIFTVGFLNAIARGEKIRVVAARGSLTPNGCPVDGFLVRPDRREEIAAMSPEELRKLTFGVDKTWVDSFILHQWLRARGLSIDDVKTEYLPAPPARVEALRQGSLDVAFISEPWITRAADSGAGEMWLPAADVAPGFPLSMVNFGPSMLSRTDDVGARFLRAYLRAVTRYREGTTGRNLDILSGVTKLEPEMMRRMCWSVIPDGAMLEPQGLADFSAWAAEQGLADRALTVEEIWEPRFLLEASRP